MASRGIPTKDRQMVTGCGVQREFLALGHDVAEVVEAGAKLERVERPVELDVGIEWASEMRLCKCDRDETATSTQHTTNLI